MKANSQGKTNKGIKTMTLKDYEKTMNSIYSFHHAKAMDALIATKEHKSTSKEWRELWNEYKNHSLVCEELFKIQVKDIVTLVKKYHNHKNVDKNLILRVTYNLAHVLYALDHMEADCIDTHSLIATLDDCVELLGEVPDHIYFREEEEG
tara:strand:+ start:254 stop:703 length:450 start_codon:yes stop_codon:yes gene_type:complete